MLSPARRKLILAMMVSFVLSTVIQNGVPQEILAFTSSLPFKRSPSPTRTPFSVPLFPTGSLIVGPSIVVQPTIIYPTSSPSSSPTQSVPLPTIIYPTPTTKPNQLPTLVPPSPTTGAQVNTTMEAFGQCLTAKGMVFFGVNGCSACAGQKTMLGTAWKYVNAMNCSGNVQACVNLGMRTAPSWGRGGVTVIPGATSLDYLAQVSGCELPN